MQLILRCCRCLLLFVLHTNAAAAFHPGKMMALAEAVLPGALAPAAPMAPGPTPALASAKKEGAAPASALAPSWLGEAPSFLQKLWEMLADATNSDVIEWHAEGAMFEVKSPKAMGAEVLGKFFRHNNFASFQRQLNYFGFHKCGRGERGCYYRHEHFLRARPQQMLRITRKTNHSNNPKQAVAAATVRAAGGAVNGGASATAGGGGGGNSPRGSVGGGSGGQAVGRPSLSIATTCAVLGGIGGGSSPSGVGGADAGSAGQSKRSLPLVAVPKASTPLGMLGAIAAAEASKRQCTGLYGNDPGLVPVTPLTSGGASPCGSAVYGRSACASWDSMASSSPRGDAGGPYRVSPRVGGHSMQGNQMSSLPHGGQASVQPLVAAVRGSPRGASCSMVPPEPESSARAFRDVVEIRAPPPAVPKQECRGFMI